MSVKVRVSENVLWRKVADEVLISNSATESIFGLDGAGSRMWQLLAENGSVDDVVAALAAEFDASSASIAADVAALIENLRSRGLLEIEQSAPTRAPAKGPASPKRSRAPKRRASR